MSKKLMIKIELELSPEVLAVHFMLTDSAHNAVLNSWHYLQDDLEEKLATALMEADPTLGYLWQIARDTKYNHEGDEVGKCYRHIRERACQAVKDYLIKNFKVPERFYPARKSDANKIAEGS